MTGDILLGVVVGAHGIGGGVRVKTFTEKPEHLAAYGALHTPEGRVLEVASAHAAKGGALVVRFKGLADRSAAEALTGAKLFVSRSTLPEAAHEEFYRADLIGLRAQDNEGRVIGEIHAIHDHGAGDVIEILRSDGDTLLLPFSKDFVPQINLSDGYVVVAEPPDSEAEEQRGVE
jgi:16S rRNA processing protein RimM